MIKAVLITRACEEGPARPCRAKRDRKGQRSIRLNRAYRAIYVVTRGGAVEFVSVEEVNKYDY